VRLFEGHLMSEDPSELLTMTVDKRRRVFFNSLALHHSDEKGRLETYDKHEANTCTTINTFLPRTPTNFP
jgi:hypothetical protein